MDWKLEVVIVPVADIDRAKRFYGEQVGFTVDYDNRAGEDIRNVQLTPPGSGCSIVLTTTLLMPTGHVAETRPGSAQGLQLVVPDVAAARAELAERGVDVSDIKHFEDGSWADGPGGAWNSFVSFTDPDGNSWLLQERP